jgi:transcription elongation factor Elf1
MIDGVMDKLQNELKEKKKEIEEYQNNCNHEKVIVAMVQKKDKGIQLVKQCKACNKMLGYPTQEEQKKFLNNEK